MAKTIITLEDTNPEAGEFQASIVYEGEGFDPGSVSHVLGHRLMQHLDTLAKREGQETIIGNAPSGHADGLPAIANTTLPNADSMPGLGSH